MSNFISHVVTFFDTETTALTMPDAAPLDKQPRIIELGFLTTFVRSDNTKEDLTFSQLVNPGIPLDEKITEITGLTDEDLEYQPSLSELVDQIQNRLKDTDILVAHNLSYDKQVLDYEAKRLGIEWQWPERLVCTVEFTEHWEGYRLNLDSLYEHCFGRKPSGARHRALDDARFTAEIYWKLEEMGEV